MSDETRAALIGWLLILGWLASWGLLGIAAAQAWLR